jgi:hypothetical protein
MKKLILVLAILLSVPAFALNIDLVQQSPDGNKVDLNYAGADGNNLPRAFALKIVVDSPAKIAAVTGYKTNGESTSASRGYGIYPARIIIEANGTVTSYGNPVAEPCDPGAGGGQGTNYIVLEFGSLYAPVGDVVNAPATSGTLCTLTMDCNGAIVDVNIVATEEDIYRGGVVLENGATPDPNLSDSLVYACATAPSGPNCWQLTQCHGDSKANGLQINTTDLFALRTSFGKTYYPTPTDPLYNPCADFSRDGKVNTTDLFILRAWFGKVPDANCTPGGTWPPLP